MPNVSVQISFRIKDADGEIFSMPLYGVSPDTTTVAQLVLGVQAIMQDLDAILDGQVVKAGLCLDVALAAGIKSAPVAGSEIERTALIPLSAVGVNRIWSNDIPAVAYAKFVSGSNQLDMTDADVVAYTNNFTINNPNLALSDPYGFGFDTVGQGVKTFRKHRRQTKRT